MPYAVLLQRLGDEQTPSVRTSTWRPTTGTPRSPGTWARAEVVRRTDGWTVLRDPAGLAYCVTGRAPGDV